MTNLSTQEIQELHGFLDDDLLEFISDKRTPTTNDVVGKTFSPTLPELTEKEIDELLNKAYEQQELKCDSNKMTAKRPSRASASATRTFAKPVSSKEIAETMQSGVPKKTQEDSKYCANLWDEWAIHRAKTTGDMIPYLKNIKVEELQHWICAFILEIRKKDGSEFIPNTLYHISAGIMRYLRVNGKPEIDIFKEPGFSKFRIVLDSEMKRLQAAGVGTVQQKAEPITFEEEEVLWQKGILGDSIPQSLLDTMLYMNGLYFALRGGKEHRNLRHKPSQIHLIEKPGERSYLMYVEDVSKNHPGGLKGRKIKPKVVYHHANTDKPERCFVRLYKLYNSHCPADRPDHAYYLRPLEKPEGDCWYSVQPVGHNKLNISISRMCKNAGISGFHTNHSLRATAATRLHQSGCVEEQEIMERTGHRSIEAVRSYKRTSRDQLEQVSDILNNGSNKRSCYNNVLLQVDDTTQDTSNCVSNSLSLEYRKTGTAPVFNISSCGSVIINNYLHK